MRIGEIISLRRVWGLIRKEIAILLKDKPAMVIIFLIPTVLVFSIQFGQRTGYFEPPRIAIIDLDNSNGFPEIDMSHELFKIFNKHHIDEEISLMISTNLTELNILLGNGRLDSIVVIPDALEYNLSAGFPAIIEIHIDSNNLLSFLQAQAKIDIIIQEYKDTFGIHGIFNPEVVKYLRPEGASLLFDIAPFFFPWTLFSIGTLIACQVIVSDIPKHRMALTPTNKFEIAFAKVAGIQVLLSVVALEFILLSLTFGIVIRGGLLTFFFVLWIVSLSGVTVGFMLSAFAKTPLAALQFFIFFFLLQAIVIYFIPWEELLYIFPVYNGQILMLDAVIRGVSMINLNLISIILFTMVTFLIGYAKYYRLQTLV